MKKLASLPPFDQWGPSGFHYVWRPDGGGIKSTLHQQTRDNRLSYSPAISDSYTTGRIMICQLRLFQYWAKEYLDGI